MRTEYRIQNTACVSADYLESGRQNAECSLHWMHKFLQVAIL